MYTCVAWNLEGADTRSVAVAVDSAGWWSGDNPSREQLWLGNLSSGAASLVLLAKVPPTLARPLTPTLPAPR